ncbi:alpha/beta hydrolase [Nocardiopsis nanhaiensis]
MNRIRLLGAALNTLALPAPGLAGTLLRPLWARPGKPRQIRAEDRELHQSARTGTLEVGQWSVVTYAWGDGARPVLLVHGWRSRAIRFAPLIRLLLDLGYSPVSWDAPGHGSTGGPLGTILDAQRIMGLLQEEHGDFAMVVGHSLGAPFSMYALRHGLRADRLALVSGVSDFGFFVDHFAGVLGLSPRAVTALRTAIENHYFDGDPTVWERFSAAHDPEALTSPVLLLHDEEDAFVPVGQSRITTAALGNRARLVTTEGLGHSHVISDAGSLDLVIEFLQGSSVPARTERG